MWRSVDKLLGRGRSIKVATTSAPGISTVSLTRKSPISVHRRPAPQHRALRLPTASSRASSGDNVAAAVRALPNKQCASDPIPTWLLRECSSELVPFLCRLLNGSLSKSYRPIANLSVLSKLLERLVARQLLSYLNAARLLPV